MASFCSGNIAPHLFYALVKVEDLPVIHVINNLGTIFCKGIESYRQKSSKCEPKQQKHAAMHHRLVILQTL